MSVKSAKAPKPKDERITLRCSTEFATKLKIAAAEEGIPAGDLLERLLDYRVRMLARKRAKMPSPLHPPVARDLDDGDWPF